MRVSLLIFLTTAFLFNSSLFSQEKDYPLVSIPQTHDKNIPAGWILGGSNPHDYSVGVDLSEQYSGFASAFLKSSSPKPIGFASLMQTFKAGNYKNQRIKLTAYVKTKFVSEAAAVWMRVNDTGGKPLAFDDMRTRPIIGSSEWTQVSIVLDVPAFSDEISFGILLRGKGQIWIDNIKFATVGRDIPVTDLYSERTNPLSPRNLDFEE
jgi:hypothetical protein